MKKFNQPINQRMFRIQKGCLSNMGVNGVVLFCLFVLSACGGGSSETTTAPDTTAPVITLNGDNPMNVILGSPYIEPGATAVDDRDGVISVRITGTVDTNTLGVYSITYVALDAAGNSHIASRTVTVIPLVDITPPVITLNGNNPMNVILGSPYIEPGATAVDDRDGVISVRITGTVDINTLGSYSITYVALDAAGNSHIVSRTVNVISSVASKNGDDTDSYFDRPFGITLDNINNRVLVTDHGLAALLAIDLVSGKRRVISDNTTGSVENHFGQPLGIALDSAENRALVVDSKLGGLFAVDLTSGDRIIVSSSHIGFGINLSDPQGIVLDSVNKRVLVVDSDLGALIAIDLVSGDRTVISDNNIGTGRGLVYPRSVILDSSNGRALVMDSNGVFGIDLNSGNRTIISDANAGSGINFSSLFGMAIDRVNNRLLVVDTNLGAVIAIDWFSGNRTIVSDQSIGTGVNLKAPRSMVMDSANGRLLLVDVDLKELVAVDIKLNPNVNSVAASGDRIIIKSK